ncbi:MAG: methyltransferase domain-containing protein, partial [Deltaproteobacteria bacterium]|nr:methyltransferase domain-containing protein [Deltaproteobacteria bacterium]
MSAGPGPEHLMQLMQGVQASGIYKAAVELDVFSKIAAGAKTAPELARAIECPERSTRILLDAAAALGLLAKSGGTYALTPATETFLVRGKPTFMGDLVNVFSNPMMWSASHRLADAVRADGTVLDQHAETPEHSFWEQFARSTAAIAMPAAMAMEGMLDDWLGRRERVRVLDVAAGSGLYGFTLARRPNVELTSLDWPNVLEETKRWGARLGLDASRVRYLPGNLFEVDYGGPYDLVLMSHVYHHFDEPTCAGLTKRVAAALAPGGRLAIHDFLYDPELRNPMGALFAATMLMWTRSGGTYGAHQY